ncbi:MULTISPECIES: hypothetical protein [Klebsiella]|nr:MULTISPECIES: hypothetical protein [Klebsiella]
MEWVINVWLTAVSLTHLYPRLWVCMLTALLLWLFTLDRFS